MLKIIIRGIKGLIKSHNWKEIKLTFKALYCWLWIKINKRKYYKGGNMEFLVLGRREITDRNYYPVNKKHIVISICDEDAKYVKLPESNTRIATMWLRFTDLDKEYKNYKVFNKKFAKDILDFVEMHKKYGIELIVSQCEAGISRSAGIAGALSLILNGDDKYFFKHYLPNRLVYRLIMEEANKRGLMNKINQGEREIMKGEFRTGEEVFNDLYKKIEKALAEADKMEVKEHNNLMGSKKKYITSIIRELEK